MSIQNMRMYHSMSYDVVLRVHSLHDDDLLESFITRLEALRSIIIQLPRVSHNV
jgi:hypothetical protein